MTQPDQSPPPTPKSDLVGDILKFALFLGGVFVVGKAAEAIFSEDDDEPAPPRRRARGWRDVEDDSVEETRARYPGADVETQAWIPSPDGARRADNVAHHANGRSTVVEVKDVAVVRMIHVDQAIDTARKHAEATGRLTGAELHISDRAELPTDVEAHARRSRVKIVRV